MSRLRRPAQPVVSYDFSQGGYNQFADPYRDQARRQRIASDPVAQALGNMAAESTRQAILGGGPPDQTARMQKLSRRTGEPPAMLAGREDAIEKFSNANSLASGTEKYPLLSQYLAINPYHAVAAQDDAKSMSMVGSAWDWVEKIPKAFEAGWHGLEGSGARINYWLANDVLGPAWDFLSSIGAPGGQTVGDLEKRKAERRAYWLAGVNMADAKKIAARPQYSGFMQEGLLGGLESVPTSLMATAVGAFTRSPGAAAAMMGGTTGGAAYGDARIAGLDVGTSLRYGYVQGVTEAVTEFAPESKLLGAMASRTGMLKTVTGYLAAELPGEMAATFVQSYSDFLTLNPDKTVGDWVASLPREEAMTVLGVLSGGAVQAGTMRGGVALADRVVAMHKGQALDAAIDQLGKAAETSKLRARDPEAYNELIRHMGEQSGKSHVYVPAETLREYLQSDGYDPFSDPLNDYADQVWEADEVGGDVVLPAELVFGTLPGTSAWNAIKADIRFEAGGMSAREADDFETAMEAVNSELEAATQGDAAQDTEAALTERVQQKLQDAGFTPYVARQQAEFITRRLATRAARRGETLTADAFKADVRSVLPPELQKARAADSVDLVINALRKGGNAVSHSGPSLLEWISKRGGINDSGGDLAAIGAGEWHKGKPGKRKLTRKFDPQASMGGITGEGDYGVDSTLQAAIDAGYFPELNNVGNESGPSQLDTQILYDAISAELAGSPRYASEGVVDPYRAAADELDQMLMERGLDPAGMSDAELRQVVAMMDEARGFDPTDPRILFQAYADGPRGRITFGGETPIIELFQSRNLSTLPHELGHMFLEELKLDAELGGQLAQDWDTVQAWFKENGHTVEGGTIPTEAHELFARGFERYLMEGKAPSTGLKGLFETFRGWLVSIYKNVKMLKAPISPEIREVMDRLVATDDEIQTMRDQQMLEPLFKDAASAGMTGAEYDAYQSQVRQGRDEASSELLAKTMAEIRRRETQRYRDTRAGVEAEIADEIDASPLYRAMRLLKAEKMNAQWLRNELGQDAKDLLPRGLVKEGGANPGDIAELAGYDSPRQMLDAIIGAERMHREARDQGDKRSMRERAIQTATDTEMGRRYGDPLNDGSIEREALEAVHNEKQGDVLAAELRILSRKTGQRPTPYRIARDWARTRVRQGVYSVEASPAAIQRHQRAVTKAGREAEKAMLAGKFDDAFRFKQQQMVSSALLSEAKLANDEVEAARKRMDKIARKATSKTIDQAYLEQAHTLLEAVDLRERTQKYLERKGKWEAWANEREAEGHDLVVPPSFEATLGQTNWSKLPVETLLGLDEAIKQIIHMGRYKQTLLDGQDRREFDALVQEAVDGAGGLKQKPPRELIEPGMAEAIKGGFAGIDASLLKMETVFDWLDGGKSDGVFNRVVFKPVSDAQAREQDMLKDFYAQTKALFGAVPGETTRRWRDAVVLPFTDQETGRPIRINRSQLIAMALNTGNEGNLQRLADGYGINAKAIDAYLADELNADEWQFVQGVWDTIEKLWPEIEALERRVNGIAPEKVEPRSITTPHGTFRGGYYPAVYDSTRDYKAEETRGRESDLFEGGYTRATTRASATKERAAQVKRPILLDLGVINRHLGEVIHDITHREPVMQANRFLTSQRVMKAVDQALGPEIRKQFRPWVKFVANSWAMERAGNEGFGKWLGKLRANVTAVGLGLRATTMVSQLAGYANSFEVVGEKWVSEGIARMTAHPVETFNFVMERSDEVRHRMDTLDRDIRTEIARMAASNPIAKGARTAMEARQFFYHGIGYMDRAVSIPTWLGAYNKALSEGLSEDEAAYAGDKAVRVSQGASSPKDLAAIQRGTGKWGEALKLMTMFYSYFSAQYQRQRTLYRDVSGADVRRPRSMPRLAARAFWLVVVPPLLTELIKVSMGAGDPPEDEEWWSQWIARKMLSNSIGGIPMARDVFEPAWNAARGGKVYNPQISPINRALASFVTAIGDVGKIARDDENQPKHATKDILEATGYATGLVPGQVASATQFLVDVGNGDADPQSFGDWVEGVATGKIKDE